MIDLRNHYGFTRTPFGKDLAPPCCTATPRTPRPSPGSACALVDIGNQLYQNVLNDPLRETCAA